MPDYKIIPSAEKEIEHILDYTITNHGPDQMLKYRDQLISCIENIASETGFYKTLKRKNKVLRYLHCQKHYIYALVRKNKPVLVIALYHEKMDIIKRLDQRLKGLK